MIFSTDEGNEGNNPGTYERNDNVWRIIVLTGGRETLSFELTPNVRRQSLKDLRDESFKQEVRQVEVLRQVWLEPQNRP